MARGQLQLAASETQGALLVSILWAAPWIPFLHMAQLGNWNWHLLKNLFPFCFAEELRCILGGKKKKKYGAVWSLIYVWNGRGNARYLKLACLTSVEKWNGGSGPQFRSWNFLETWNWSVWCIANAAELGDKPGAAQIDFSDIAPQQGSWQLWWWQFWDWGT